MPEGDIINTTDRRPATIVDVAREAGVSFKTVSRVLNGEPNVRVETRTRVMEAVGRLGYRANQYARSLRAGQSRLIGVFYTNPSRNYLGEIQIGALQRGNAEGFSIAFEQLAEEEGGAAILPRGGAELAGAILTPPLTEDIVLMQSLAAAGTPFVRLSHTEADGETGRVTMDDIGAAHEVAEHLIALGHRRIGFIAGPPSHPQSLLRENGFRAGLAAHGLTLEDALIVRGNFDFESGLRAAGQLLALAERPTAIFASNDDMAAAVLTAAYRSGLRVPQQLSVVGFDDTPLASIVYPALTSVAQPSREMASVAVGMLLDKTASEAPQAACLPHRLVVRETTAAPEA
ncbi:LacI family transcriptional regulator [Hyphomonas sp. WL0036]|uniref:LacI family DNA-binding transcriptional regulator n=1 Tax=Hyphomonas sediminis TaxID=2866160 RepID=UPI001C8232B8|nr:LacI family DNA-binding transcriptional regulator [Hyphomonas sediminis]MBY9066966.1 LacI family transcriptional regulator [Hyphomonas sediminis]